MKKFVDLRNKLAETLERGQQVAKHSRMSQLRVTIPRPMAVLEMLRGIFSAKKAAGYARMG